MAAKYKTRGIFIAGVIIGLFVLMCGPVPCVAENDEPSEQRSAARAEPYADYPEIFSGRGVLEFLTAEAVVIDDSGFDLGTGINYHVPGQNYASAASFKKGDFVAYVQNLDGEIISLWKLNRIEDLMPN